tara:strand:+ start:1773 stop:2306 length:534 start_codon:yes stop_codon:yes gene_type:complete
MEGIYKISKDNKPVYVGQSRNMFRRWMDHERGKYPSPEYKYEVLEECSENLSKREQYWISEYNLIEEGDNKKEPDPMYSYVLRQKKLRIRNLKRLDRLYSTFKGKACPCGQNEPEVLQYYPHHQQIKSAVMRHGKDSKEVKLAGGLAALSRVVCANCFARLWDAKFRKEDIPFYLKP